MSRYNKQTMLQSRLAALCTLALVALAAGATAAQERPRFGPGALRDAQAAAASVPAGEAPDALRDVGFDQRLGEAVPPDLVFRDEEGRQIKLGEYFGERPALLSLVYYECPMLCPMTLRGLASSLKALELEVGEDYEVIVVSFDPGEGPALAAERKLDTVHRYGRAGTEEGWHFLTGEPEAVARLTEAVGFRYVYEPERDEYAHAAGLVMLTPEGEIARYFFGIEYPAKDLKLGLVETTEGEIGTVVDQLLLYCFHYDPETGQYVWSNRAMIALRWAGATTVLALASFIFLMVRKERHESRATRSA